MIRYPDGRGFPVRLWRTGELLGYVSAETADPSESRVCILREPEWREVDGEADVFVVREQKWWRLEWDEKARCWRTGTRECVRSREMSPAR